MGKTLEETKFCKLSEKLISDELDTYIALTSKPKYICRKCFRVSTEKKNLCRPEKLKKFNSSS